MLNLRADSFHVLNLRAQRALMSSTNELNTLYTDVESDVLNLRAQEHALYWNTLYTDVESPSWLVSTRFHSKVERALTNQRTRVLNRIESQLRTTSTTTCTPCRARTKPSTTLPSIGTRRARGGPWALACSDAGRVDGCERRGHWSHFTFNLYSKNSFIFCGKSWADLLAFTFLRSRPPLQKHFGKFSSKKLLRKIS